MRRGRKPDPPELRVLKANRDRPPAGPFAATRVAGEPPKPATIAMDPVASEEWDRVVGILVDRRVLSPADMALLACYCSAWSTVCRCRELLARPSRPSRPPEPSGDDHEAPSEALFDPFLTYTAAGGLKCHPAVSALNQAETNLARFAAELGLSPSARGRVTTLEDLEAPKSKLSAFL